MGSAPNREHREQRSGDLRRSSCQTSLWLIDRKRSSERNRPRIDDSPSQAPEDCQVGSQYERRRLSGSRWDQRAGPQERRKAQPALHHRENRSHSASSGKPWGDLLDNQWDRRLSCAKPSPGKPHQIGMTSKSRKDNRLRADQLRRRSVGIQQIKVKSDSNMISKT